MFSGGPEESLSRLGLPEDEVVRVFCELFEHRARAKRHIPVAPLDDYIKSAALRIAGQPQVRGILREMLDNIFVVNVNGDVFTRPFAYDRQFCLGNLNTASMPEMIGGKTYGSCKQEILKRKLRNCTGCESFGFCNTFPMHEHGSVTEGADGGRCVIARQSIRDIESALVSSGVDGTVIADWTRQNAAVCP